MATSSSGTMIRTVRSWPSFSGGTTGISATPSVLFAKGSSTPACCRPVCANRAAAPPVSGGRHPDVPRQRPGVLRRHEESLMDDAILAGLPGEALVRAGLTDLAAGRRTTAGYLVLIAARRLRDAGIRVP